jgi:hypothetical protein
MRSSTSENPQKPNFVECPKGEVRRILFPRNLLNKPRVTRSLRTKVTEPKLRRMALFWRLSLPIHYRYYNVGDDYETVSEER